MDYRRHFPLLTKTYPDLVYLDSGATTQKPEIVIDRIGKYYREENSNVHRGAYRVAEMATKAYEDARAAVQKFINAQSPEEIIFTRGTTEGVNLVASTWGEMNIGAGDEIIVTILEHHANFLPWQQLAKRKGANLVVAYTDKEGMITAEMIQKLLTPRTKLVAVAQVSNVLGTILPVKEIATCTHTAGAKIFVDAAQSIGHMPVDVQDLGIDWLSLSGHKMYGPTGIGVLFGKRELLEAMPLYQVGGGMISKVTLDGYEPAELPSKFEAGTPAVAEAVGLVEAIRFIEIIGRDVIAHHERELIGYCMEKLAGVPGLTLYGPTDSLHHIGAYAFTIDGLHAHDIASALGIHHIAVRAGQHCAGPLHTHLGVSATCRASFGIYNTREDIDKLYNALQETLFLSSQGTLLPPPIREHAAHPRHSSSLANPSILLEDQHRSCGDGMSVEVVLGTGDTIQEIYFAAEGCALAKAAASLLGDHVIGMSKSSVLKITTGDIASLVGITPESGRITCATLPLITLQKALSKK